MGSYIPFIKGELVSLCVPDERAIDVDGWAEWFNATARLGATRHGIFPNTRVQQKARLANMPSNELSLIICDAQANTAFGVISLQLIDLVKREAEVSLTVGQHEDKRLPRFAALEAMARITAHGFDELGLMRITAGQAAHLLVKWNKHMEMVGYRTEGVLRDAFQRGHLRADVFRIAARYENYLALKEFRNGCIWPGQDAIQKLSEQQPDPSFAEKVSRAIQDLEDQHFDYLMRHN